MALWRIAKTRAFAGVGYPPLPDGGMVLQSRSVIGAFEPNKIAFPFYVGFHAKTVLLGPDLLMWGFLGF